eukprot:scaffold1334_cov170-Ochromonas_danica.AAC.3
MSIRSLPLDIDIDLFSLQELEENDSTFNSSTSLVSSSEEHLSDSNSTHDDNDDEGEEQNKPPQRVLRGEHFRSLRFTFKRLGPLEHAKHVLTLAEALPDHSLILLGCRIIRYLYKEVSVIEMYAAAKATRLIYPNGDEDDVLSGHKCSPVVNEGHIIKAKGVIANNIPSFR